MWTGSQSADSLYPSRSHFAHRNSTPNKDKKKKLKKSLSEAEKLSKNPNPSEEKAAQLVLTSVCGTSDRLSWHEWGVMVLSAGATVTQERCRKPGCRRRRASKITARDERRSFDVDGRRERALMDGDRRITESTQKRSPVFAREEGRRLKDPRRESA